MLYQTKNPHGGDIYGEPVVLDYSANTNPFGTPQGILDAMVRVLPELHRYPDPYCRELVRAIAAHEKLPEEYILCGNGAADLIYSYCQAKKPKKAMELAPTFSEYALGLQQTGCTPERYLLKEEEGFLPGAEFLSVLAGRSPDVLFLCTPNNPTGRLLSPEFLQQVLRICREKEISLFLDECFLDLSDDGISMKDFLADNPQLFILKAFTKSYGMAGVRLGYGLSADSSLLTKMSQAVQPWNISTLAQAAGRAALQEQAFLAETRALVQTERERLRRGMQELGFTVFPSSVNFLLFRAPAGLDRVLRRRQIAIRSCANYCGLGEGWYRIAVRLPQENIRLLAAMREARNEL